MITVELRAIVEVSIGKGGVVVRRKLGLVLVVVLALGVAGFAQTAVTPRSVSVLLFDNDTGTTVTKLGIIFDKAVTLTTSDIIAFGGEEATLVAASNNYVFIDVVVVPGGTLQITLSGDGADAVVTNAFWFE
jgi:hypothetical protein